MIRPVAAAGFAAGGWALVAVAPLALAYDFDLNVRTLGQGYQVRRFAGSGVTELLNRRRLTQLLDLRVYDLEPDSWEQRGAPVDDGGDGGHLSVELTMRFDSDFGDFMLGRPRGLDEIRELQQNQVDVLAAAVVARNLGDRIDLRLGRQMVFDLGDFYAFDGAHAAVALAHRLSVEAFGGLQVRGDLPLGSPIYELDGTSSGSRDPATGPAQSSALLPTAGAAVGLDRGRGVAARVAYRRTWSETARPQPGAPASGVNEEKVGLTAEAAWRGTVFVAGALRYNLLLGVFDDQQAVLRARLGARHAVQVEHVRLVPTFDGDSIWNVFAAGAFRDLRAGWDARVGAGVTTHVRGFHRAFAGAREDGDGGAWGANAGAALRRPGSILRADLYLDEGHGQIAREIGGKRGADVSGRLVLAPGRLELEGRLTGYSWRTGGREDGSGSGGPGGGGQSGRPATRDGIVFGAQIGGRYQMTQGMHVHLLVEDNVGTYYRSQFRALAVVDVEVAP